MPPKFVRGRRKEAIAAKQAAAKAEDDVEAVLTPVDGESRAQSADSSVGLLDADDAPALSEVASEACGGGGSGGSAGGVSAVERVVKSLAAMSATELMTEHARARDALMRGVNLTTSTQQRSVHKHARDIHIEKLNLALFGKEIVQDADLHLNWGQRYGLIGANGCGKSTLMTVLGRRMVPLPEGMDIFHVTNEIEPSDKSALQAVMEADSLRASLERESEAISDALAAPDIDPSETDVLSERLGEIYERLDELGADTAEVRAASILHGLGFTPEMQRKKTREFSGGWRMRVALARALFLNPSFLLLDEPTNHLDMEAVVWLESYLSNFNKILFLVSHSQDFLDNVTTQIIHFHKNTLTYYGGNYSQYVVTRAERLEAQAKRHAWEQDQIKHMKDYIARFGHGYANLAKQAQSKEKVLAKMEAAGLTEAVTKDMTITMRFNDPGKIPPPVLQLQSISFGYPGQHLLYKDVDFGIDLDSRIALVGPNGAGKTTLVKLICGELIPTGGQVRPHAHLRFARFTQHFVDALDMNDNALNFFKLKYPDRSLLELRGLLGRFGVAGDNQTRKMEELSDGIKSRIVFSLMASRNPHILLLDEPTNHLDIESIDALGDALQAFEGGVVLVSHDMRLISKVAKEIWVCDHRCITRFPGDIMAFKEQLKDRLDRERARHAKKSA